jgi:hypothetical protein
MLNLNTLQVGQKVAVARYGSWTIMSEGVYIVAKADKVKVVVKRESDGYERTFSVKKGTEKGSTRYHSAFLESIEDRDARIVKKNAENEVRLAWSKAEQAAQSKNISALRQAMADLELLVK